MACHMSALPHQIKNHAPGSPNQDIHQDSGGRTEMSTEQSIYMCKRFFIALNSSKHSSLHSACGNLQTVIHINGKKNFKVIPKQLNKNGYWLKLVRQKLNILDQEYHNHRPGILNIQISTDLNSAMSTLINTEKGPFPSVCVRYIWLCSSISRICVSTEV